MADSLALLSHGVVRTLDRSTSPLKLLVNAIMADGKSRTSPYHSPTATFDSLLDLVRRLPPTRIERNVDTLCDICPEYADDLLGNVDQPLKVLRDEGAGREYLGCDYNRDGDSFRWIHRLTAECT